MSPYYKPEHTYFDIFLRDIKQPRSRTVSKSFRIIDKSGLKNEQQCYYSRKDDRLTISIRELRKNVKINTRYDGEEIEISGMLEISSKADDIVKQLANSLAAEKRVHLIYDESIERGWYTPESQLKPDVEQYIKLLEMTNLDLKGKIGLVEEFVQKKYSEK